MFAVGHIALGYIIGKLISRCTGQDTSLPLIWALSLLPDLDFFTNLKHRGPTHGIILMFIISAPFLVLYFNKAVQYVAVLASHTLIGDYFTDKTMLFWPLSTEWFNFPYPLRVGSVRESYLELAFFGVFIGMMVLTRDFHHLMSLGIQNFFLIIPLGALLSTLYVMIRYPFIVSRIMLVPNLFLIAVILISISTTILHMRVSPAV